nr:hypothetical protein [Streptomyces sp. 11-1-2]
MRAGVVVAAQPGVEDLAVRAEELGLHSFWVNDRWSTVTPSSP